MVTIRRRVERAPFAGTVALMFGAVAAVLVEASGFPGEQYALPMRMAAMLLAFGTTWAILRVLLGPLGRRLDRRPAWQDEGYAADFSRSSARVRPIYAPVELGAPLMSDEAIAPPFVEAAQGLEAPLSVREFANDADTTGATSIPELIERLEAGLARRSGGPPPEHPDPEPLELPAAWLVAEGEGGEPPPAHEDAEDYPSSMKRYAWR